MKKKSSYRRGYAVAILLGLERNKAVLWRVYSKVLKPEKTIQLEGDKNAPKDIYNFHEAIVNALRPALGEGVRSIIVVSQPKTSYAKEFTNHIRRHHTWLNQGKNKIELAEIAGNAITHSGVTELAKDPQFKKAVEIVTSSETENLLELLESRLNTLTELVLYDLEDIENAIIYEDKNACPEFLFLTDEHLATGRRRNRIQRLIQIASNKKIQTRVVSSQSLAGKRLSQLGGIVCILRAS